MDGAPLGNLDQSQMAELSAWVAENPDAQFDDPNNPTSVSYKGKNYEQAQVKNGEIILEDTIDDATGLEKTPGAVERLAVKAAAQDPDQPNLSQPLISGFNIPESDWTAGTFDGLIDILREILQLKKEMIWPEGGDAPFSQKLMELKSNIADAVKELEYLAAKHQKNAAVIKGITQIAGGLISIGMSAMSFKDLKASTQPKLDNNGNMSVTVPPGSPPPPGHPPVVPGRPATQVQVGPDGVPPPNGTPVGAPNAAGVQTYSIPATPPRPPPGATISGDGSVTYTGVNPAARGNLPPGSKIEMKKDAGHVQSAAQARAAMSNGISQVITGMGEIVSATEQELADQLRADAKRMEAAMQTIEKIMQSLDKDNSAMDSLFSEVQKLFESAAQTLNRAIWG